MPKLSRALEKVVFCGLLAVAVISTIPYGSVDAWWEAFFECAVFLLFALWIFEVLLRGSWQVKELLVIVPLICMTAYIFLQTMQLPGTTIAPANVSNVARYSVTIDRYQTYLTAVKTLALTLFTGLLLVHTSTPSRFRWLVRTVVGIGVGSALFGILRQLMQSSDSTTPFALPFLYGGLGYGQFLSANVFSYLMEMILGIVGGFILGNGVRRQLILIYLAAVIIMFSALVWSNSRGGIVGLICQSVFLISFALAWYSERRLSKEDLQRYRSLNFLRSSWLLRSLAVLLIVGTVVIGVLWIGGDRLAGKLSSTPDDIVDGTTRKQIWSASWQLVKSSPVTGVGFGSFFLAIPQYQVGSGRLKVAQAHNDYLDLAASGGIIGLVLAAWFVAFVLWRASITLRSKDSYRRAAALGALAGMLSVAIHSLLDFGLQITGIAVVFAALVVIAVADSNVETVEAKRTRPVPLNGSRSGLAVIR
jgi:O-antigen ligase